MLCFSDAKVVVQSSSHLAFHQFSCSISTWWSLHLNQGSITCPLFGFAVSTGRDFSGVASRHFRTLLSLFTCYFTRFTLKGHLPFSLVGSHLSHILPGKAFCIDSWSVFSPASDPVTPPWKCYFLCQKWIWIWPWRLLFPSRSFVFYPCIIPAGNCTLSVLPIDSHPFPALCASFWSWAHRTRKIPSGDFCFFDSVSLLPSK